MLLLWELRGGEPNRIAYALCLHTSSTAIEVPPLHPPALSLSLDIFRFSHIYARPARYEQQISMRTHNIHHTDPHISTTIIHRRSCAIVTQGSKEKSLTSVQHTTNNDKVHIPSSIPHLYESNTPNSKFPSSHPRAIACSKV